MKPLDKVRVLVVDDDEDSRELIRVALELYGAVATCVAGASEGLAEIQRSVPNVVVSDLSMPGEDGHAFLRKVRALPRDRGGRIPAVALTAMTSRESRMASRDAGFHYHLDKPVDTEKLVEIVQSLVRLTQSG
jgi:CheY-like chemotaxis protein